MSLPHGWELVLILLVILVLFGAKRMPDAARGLGRSLRIFKAETKGLRDSDETPRETGYRDTTAQPTDAAPRAIEPTSEGRPAPRVDDEVRTPSEQRDASTER